MEKPFFSIIIPTLNEEKFLPKLLNDLEKQIYSSFEVFIVDGNSDDTTRTLARSFVEKMNVTVLTVKKRNVSYQRNYGAKKSKGIYLIFLDADARVNPTFLKKLSKSLSITKFLLCIPQYAPLDTFFHDKTVFTIFNFLIEFSQKTVKPFSVGVCLIFEKNYFNFLGGFDDSLFLSEDHDVVQRAKQAEVTAHILRDVVVKVSLRRFRREGRLEVLHKYFVATLHMLRSQRVQKPIFEYQMGGAQYVSKMKTKSIDKEIYDYFEQLKKRFTDSLYKLGE